MLLTNKKHRATGVLPALFFFLFFFLWAVIQSIWVSFGNGIYNQVNKGTAYEEISNLSFLESLGVTVGLSLVVSFLSGILGLGIAFYLAQNKRSWLRFLLQIPIGVPHLLAGYLLTQILWQSGWMSRLLFYFGWIDGMEQFPILVHDTWGVGIVLAYLWKEIPFIVLLIYPFLVKLIDEWSEISATLGASKNQTNKWIILPLLLPIWVGGMWVVFAFALGAYEIPALMGRTNFGSIPVLAWKEYTQFGIDRQPVAISMNVVLGFVSLIMGIILIFLQNKWYQKGRRMW